MNGIVSIHGVEYLAHLTQCQNPHKRTVSLISVLSCLRKSCFAPSSEVMALGGECMTVSAE